MPTKEEIESLHAHMKKIFGGLKDSSKDRMAHLRYMLLRMKQCPGPHQFEPLPDGNHFKCKICGGEVGPIERHWYQLGLKDGLLALGDKVKEGDKTK